MAPSPSGKVLGTVNDFLTLPLHIPPVPAFPQAATHYLYLRAHTPKVSTADTSRQLFLVNVPFDATETHIFNLFAKHLGGVRVESVAFESARLGKGITAPVAPAKPSKKRKRDDGEEDTSTRDDEAVVGVLPDPWDRDLHRSGSTAVVTFVDKASAQLALKEARRAIKEHSQNINDSKKVGITWTAAKLAPNAPPLGSARYLAHHRLRYPSYVSLQASVDAYMEAFTAQEEARARLLARQRSEPDADGFVTVTRGARHGPAREEETRAREAELKKREKKRVGVDFYRFQVREKKKEAAKDLVREFEEDRKKLGELKKRRGRIRPK